MARLETWYKQDLKKPLIVHKHADVFNQDSRGNLIGVEVYKDGEPVTLAGSISGYCLLADGTTVPAVGASRSGNKASVLIPQTAYGVPGPITITIKNVEGNDITTLCAVVGLVRQSVSGNLVNPGSVVTDWSNSINAQLQAVQTAADNVGAIVAAPFDENTVYVAGNYVTNNGNLYRITGDHAAGVTWANTQKVQCTVGSELSDLKSAINDIEGIVPGSLVKSKKITSATTTTTYILINFHLDAGQYLITYYQDNDITSCTRNTVGYVRSGSGDSVTYDITWENVNLEKGFYTYPINITEAGNYSFAIFGHTLSQDTIYKNFCIRKNYIPYDIWSSIAYVNSGFTARKAFAVGDLVFIFGKLYKVKTATTRGTNFVVGTSIEETTIDDNLDAIGGRLNHVKALKYFVGTDFVQGSISNGTAYPSATEAISSDQFYGVKGNEIIIITEADPTGAWQVRVCSYDVNKGWLRQTSYTAINGIYSYQVGQDAGYIKLCLSKKENGSTVRTNPSTLLPRTISLLHSDNIENASANDTENTADIVNDLRGLHTQNPYVAEGSCTPTINGYNKAITGLTLCKGCRYRITTYADASLNQTSNVAIRAYNKTIKSFDTVWAKGVQVHEFVLDNTYGDASIEHYTSAMAGTIYDRLEMVSDCVSIPACFRTQMATKVPEIMDNMCDAGINGETIIFITDLHWETNFQNSPKLIKYLLDNLNINQLICGGDIINQGDKDKMQTTMLNCIKAFDFKNVFFPCAVGNHDDNSNFSPIDPDKRFSQSEIFALMEKQVGDNVTFVTDGPWNFYYDITATKTRVIVLDTGYDGSFNKYSELYAMLNGIPQGYHAVIAVHWLYNGGLRSSFCENLEAIVDDYNAKQTGTVSGVAYDFSQAEGDVKIIIAGHVHADMDWTTQGGVPVVLTDCDSALRTQSTMEFGTVDEQCFDVITLDYEHNTAKFVRIGRGEDREFDLV